MNPGDLVFVDAHRANPPGVPAWANEDNGTCVGFLRHGDVMVYVGPSELKRASESWYLTAFGLCLVNHIFVFDT